MPLVLNQYRSTSSYKDIVGERYHFPNRYLARFQTLPATFVYYEPREGGEQVYFGAGVVRAIVPDTEDEGHSYADLDTYRIFPTTLNYHAGPDAHSWERSTTMRNSVREISPELFTSLLTSAGIELPVVGEAVPTFYENRLAARWDAVRLRHEPLSLRVKRRLLEAYERPSWVSNHVKSIRGDTCQLCNQRGFLKRDGTRYSEIHHMMHLAEDPPEDCLNPDYLVVLCANCHRRMHYARVSTPTRTVNGWRVSIDGQDVDFVTSE